MTRPDDHPADTILRRRRRYLAGAVVIFATAAVALLSLRTRTPLPPAVSTAGLDPAVAKLIEETLQGARMAPDSGAAWGRLGSVLMHYEFVAEARLAFDEAEELSPSEARWPYLHGVLVMTHDGNAAVAKLRRAVELCRDTPDMPRLRLAQFLAERGRADEAERHFRALLQFKPDHAPALLGMARLRHAQGRWVESTNHLHACLNSPHTAKSAHALLAAVQQALGNSQAAETAARQGARIPAEIPWPDPYWQEAAAYRVGHKAMIADASAALDQGRIAEALQLLTAATREYPNDGEAWYLMGWAWNRAGSGEGEDSAFRASRSAFAAAEQALREHLRRSPQSPKGRSQLAVALLNQQRYAEAIEVLATAVKEKPTWRELHSNLGYACVQLDRFDEALRHFRNALECDPNHPPSYLALAELLSRRGNTTEASRLLRQALEIAPNDPRVTSLLQRIGPDP